MPWFYGHREGQKKSFLRAPSWTVRSVPGPLAASLAGTPCLGVIWATGEGFTGKTILCTEDMVTPLIWPSEVLFRASVRRLRRSLLLDQIKIKIACASEPLAGLGLSFKCKYCWNRHDSMIKGWSVLPQVTLRHPVSLLVTWRRDKSSHFTQFLLLGIAAKKQCLSSKQSTLLLKLSCRRTWSLLPYTFSCHLNMLVNKSNVCMGSNEEKGTGIETTTNHAILFTSDSHFLGTACNFRAASRHKDNCSSGTTLCVKQIWHLRIVFSHYLFAVSWANDLKNWSLLWH